MFKIFLNALRGPLTVFCFSLFEVWDSIIRSANWSIYSRILTLYKRLPLICALRSPLYLILSLYSRFDMNTIIRDFEIVRGQTRLSRILKLYKGNNILLKPLTQPCTRKHFPVVNTAEDARNPKSKRRIICHCNFRLRFARACRRYNARRVPITRESAHPCRFSTNEVHWLYVRPRSAWVISRRARYREGGGYERVAR